MECEECGTKNADRAQVRFQEDGVATLALCPECTEQFRMGDLVEVIDVNNE